MRRLTDVEIANALNSLAEWERKGEGITRLYKLKDFAEALSFVNKVAGLAEQADHHPDIDIRYNKVRLTLSTHSAGGLTDKDFSLARQIG